MPRQSRMHGVLDRSSRCIFVVAALLSLAGCAALSPAKTAAPVFYTLDGLRPTTAAATAMATATVRPTAGPVLIVGPTRAAPGFDSQRILYLRTAHKLEYFAHSEWVEPPARMLAPLLVTALERSGSFRAVVPVGGSPAGDLRLDTELLQLQQDFRTRPSHVRLVLRATLVDDKSRQVIAVRQFEVDIAAASDDPYGGVLAANQALAQVLDQLAAFCSQAISASLTTTTPARAQPERRP